MEIFTDEWACGWREELNASDTYHKAAADWEGSVVAAVYGSDKAVFLDLAHGFCTAARAATEDDLAGATFLLSAKESVWLRLFEGKMDPVFALMLGQLRLMRGRMSDLSAHANGAKQLLLTAQRIHG